MADSTLRTRLESMLDCLKIEQVISVDDYWAPQVNLLITLGRELDGSQRAEVLSGGQLDDLADDDAWRDEVEARWADANRVERQEMISRIEEIAGESEAVRDVQAMPVLEDALSNERFEKMSLGDWEDRGLKMAQERASLVLFDLGFAGEGRADDEGVRLITALQKEAQEEDKVWAGILTHQVIPAEEHSAWQKIEGAGPDPKRTLVISKARLTEGGFDDRFRAVLWAPLLRQILEAVGEIVKSNRKRALKEAQGLDAHELQSIVMESSREEGIWEAETLLRLLELLERERNLTDIWKNTAVRSATKRLRCLADVPTAAAESDPEAGPPEKANSESVRDTAPPDPPAPPDPGKTKISTPRRYQRREIYSEGDHINALMKPLTLGDIFVKEPGEAQFVVIAQPCDLMLRSDGKRQKSCTHVAVARIGIGEADKPTRFKLPYFDSDSGDHGFVDVARYHWVRVDALDPACYRDDGRSQLGPDDTCPEHLPESARKRHEQLLKQLRGQLDLIARRTKAKQGGAPRNAKPLPPAIIDALLQEGSPQPFKPSLELGPGTVKYGARRILRLSDSYGQALLHRWIAHMGRDALPHDFARLFDSLDRLPNP